MGCISSVQQPEKDPSTQVPSYPRRGMPCVCRVAREEVPDTQRDYLPSTRHTQGMPLRGLHMAIRQISRYTISRLKTHVEREIVCVASVFLQDRTQGSALSISRQPVYWDRNWSNMDWELCMGEQAWG